MAHLEYKLIVDDLIVELDLSTLTYQESSEIDDTYDLDETQNLEISNTKIADDTAKKLVIGMSQIKEEK